MKDHNLAGTHHAERMSKWKRQNLNQFFLAAIFMIIAALSPSHSFAQNQSAANIRAEIATQAITIQNTGGLHFGRIAPYGRNGNVTVHANSYTVATNAFLVNESMARAASWIVTGIPGASYRVLLPANALVTSGNSQMTISSLFRSGASQLTLDALGQGTFTVGGILNVGANQPAGNYTGSFTVTVSYD